MKAERSDSAEAAEREEAEEAEADEADAETCPCKRKAGIGSSVSTLGEFSGLVFFFDSESSKKCVRASKEEPMFCETSLSAP
eukprot:2010000-Rhodomonas_salina.1